jgi:hypothetical protein
MRRAAIGEAAEQVAQGREGAAAQLDLVDDVGAGLRPC